MKQIEVTIPLSRRRLWRIWRKKYTCSLAENWAELTETERLFCLQKLLAIADATVAKSCVLPRLLKMPTEVFFDLDEDDQSALIDQLDWLKIEGHSTPLIKEFTHNGTGYTLPKAKFQDGTAIEFALADQFLETFTQSGDTQDLLKLVGALAAPTEKGKRLPLLNREDAEHRADVLRGLPFETAMAVLLCGVGVKEYVSKSYPFLFDDADDEDDVNVRAAVAHFPNFGWWGAYLGIAETGVFGNYAQVLQTNFHRICMFLTEKRKENKRQRAAFKSNNPTDGV